jgi:hypothetical protein
MTLAVEVLKPNVIALKVIELGFEKTADGIDDAAVGGIGEAGDVFVDGLEGFVEIDILRAGGRRKKKGINTEGTEEEAQSSQRRMEKGRNLRGREPNEFGISEVRGLHGHGFGCGPV